MNKFKIVIILIASTIAIFVVANLIVNQSSKNEFDTAEINTDNINLDCSGVWEGSPLCVERKNAFIALQNLESKFVQINDIVQQSNTNNFNQARILKREGDQFLKDEFYFKAENKYKESLKILNQLSSDFLDTINELKNKGKIAYDKNELEISLEYYLEAKELIDDNEIELYISKINNRSEIEKYNLIALESLEKNKFELAREKNNLALNLDNQFAPTLKLKLEIYKKEKKFNFTKALKLFYQAVDNDNFNLAKDNLFKATKLMPSSQEITQAQNTLLLAERKFYIEKYEIEKNEFKLLEKWDEAMNSLNKLKEINPGLINNEEELYLKSIIKFYKLFDIHKNQPDRLSSQDVLEEANYNYDLGMKLSSNKTGKLNDDLLEIKTLIEQYSQRTVITFRSNNQTYLDIKRFKKFEPFKEFSISVRPGEYIFIAKKPGIEAKRKEFLVSPNTSNLFFYIGCDIVCEVIKLDD